MSYKSLCVRQWFVAAALFVLGVSPGFASNALQIPGVSGSYAVIQQTALGSQTQVRMRIHLVNHGSSNLSIQRLTLWDFSHPDAAGNHVCAVTLRAHASVDTTQEFTIRRSEYQLWQRGLRPRFILQMASAGNARSKAVVRLNRISVQE